MYSIFIKLDELLNMFLIPKESTFSKAILKVKVLLDKHVVHSHSLGEAASRENYPLHLKDKGSSFKSDYLQSLLLYLNEN